MQTVIPTGSRLVGANEPSQTNAPAVARCAPDASEMLVRMRSGDRAAASEFLSAFGDQIRRRIHGKLAGGVRRVFDSQEIMSTLGRRLDRLVLSGELRAIATPQLWALIFKIIDVAVMDKVRVFSRLQAAEGEDSSFATDFARRMKERERADVLGPELELEAAFGCLRSDTDRKVLELWLNGAAHAEIAETIHTSVDAVRQRWRSIRDRLHEQLTAGAI